MKPKSIRAALQLMLPEIEEMLSLGVSREEIYKAVSERFGLEGVNVRSFDTSLYRARQIRKNGMHNTQTPPEPEPQGSEKKESPGIIDKEFFNKISEDFDPKMFNKKF
ncbi:plasmid stabilization protein StbA [Klebsiella michiganensis]